MIFKAIVHEEGEMFWAEVPSLPGCATQGETLEELKANLKEAIEAVLDVDIDMSVVELEKLRCSKSKYEADYWEGTGGTT